MKIFDIMSEVEDQGVQIERARSVLASVIEDFERVIEPGTTQALLFIQNQSNMRNLLHVADGLLFGVLPELEKVVKSLLEHHKDEKGGDAA